MQRRQLSERRAKDAASSLIREVTGKKERDPNSMTNKQVSWVDIHCFVFIYNWAVTTDHIVYGLS